MRAFRSDAKTRQRGDKKAPDEQRPARRNGKRTKHPPNNRAVGRAVNFLQPPSIFFSPAPPFFYSAPVSARWSQSRRILSSTETGDRWIGKCALVGNLITRPIVNSRANIDALVCRIHATSAPRCVISDCTTVAVPYYRDR